MKPYDKVSSLLGTNTLLQGQQINGQNTEDRSQKADKSSRSKEGPTQIREDKIKG
jgi:hypothetical protein